MKCLADLHLHLSHTQCRFRHPFFPTSLSLGSTSERKGKSLTKEIVRKAKGGVRNEEITVMTMARRGREVQGEREHGARSGKTEIQFERCMLDPLAGSAHFEIGYSFYCESGLLPVYTASELTAESRTRKGRESRRKRKGPCVWGGFLLSFVPPTLWPSPSSPGLLFIRVFLF